MRPTDRSASDTHRKSRRNAAMTHDVLIIGGGMAGGTMATLLGHGGFDVACIDRDDPAAQTDQNFDGRTIAISWGSRRVLDAAGVWGAMDDIACPIRTIDILDGGSPVLLRFDSAEVGNRSFGWIVENRLLRTALFDRMRDLKTADHIAPANVAAIDRDNTGVSVTLADGRVLRAPLLIGADGRNSFVRDWAGIGTRGWAYDQRAIVCTVIHDNPHDHVAVEHFRDQGPFAILPMTDDENGNHRSSIVWTEHAPERESLLRAADDVFDAGLNARFPAQYGRVRHIGKRFSFPLGLQNAHEFIAPRVALVADAAHGIHPIAGQGLNMGFRDIAALYAVLAAARENGDDIGSDAVLNAYQQQRRFDNMAMAGATDGLNRLFSNRHAPLPVLRKAGLKLVSRVPVVKKFFMSQAMGAAGLLPDIIREAREAS